MTQSQDQRDYQRAYASRLISEYRKPNSDIRMMIEPSLMYFRELSAFGTHTILLSVRDYLAADDLAPERYLDFFRNLRNGFTEQRSQGRTIRVYTRKVDNRVYQVAMSVSNYRLSTAMTIWLIVLSAHTGMTIMLMLFRRYYISAVQAIAEEAFQNSELSPPRMLSERNTPFTDVLVMCLNKLIIAINEKERDIADHEKHRFIFDTSQRITHNISNLLNPIDYHLQQLEGTDDPDLEAIREQFIRIRREFERLKQLNSSVLQFESYPLDAVIRIVISQLRYLECTIDYQDDSPTHGTAEVDPELIRDALLNLVKNAAEAALEEGQPRVQITLQSSALYHELDIENPIAADHLPDVSNLTNPFQSSKPSGLGIGVAVARRIIDQHHGELHYQVKKSVIRTRVKIPKQAPREFRTQSEHLAHPTSE